ncbi:MAG: tRNA preQ1(34) S-adenosylmethionine ribosyltransferase-isomerase QueA [Acetobacteraceae bacterium]
MMELAEFDFDLPPERIAAEPARPRDAARLLYVRTARLEDRIVRDLPVLLRPGDLLVTNDTRVIPARLSARRGSARIGLTLDRPLANGTWRALARNARRLRVGETLAVSGAAGFAARIEAKDADGMLTLRFDREGAAFAQALEAAGALALPPYIPRPAGPTSADRDDYQTIFARHPGAVAAPTAGLHFTPALLDALAARGIGRASVTLHVGAGTFLPVRNAEIERHHVHPERGAITEEAAAAINRARAAGGRIIAVGTTALRLIESAADAEGSIMPFAGETDLYIRPGYGFRAADVLLTNFHLPRSSLFILAAAFAGLGRIRAAYAHAIAAGYRFYSYGDATLLERAS